MSTQNMADEKQEALAGYRRALLEHNEINARLKDRECTRTRRLHFALRRCAVRVCVSMCWRGGVAKAIVCVLARLCASKARLDSA